MTYTNIYMTMNKTTGKAFIETDVTMNRITLAHNVTEYEGDEAQAMVETFLKAGGRLLYEDAKTAEYTM